MLHSTVWQWHPSAPCLLVYEHHDVEAQVWCVLNLTAHPFLFHLLFLVPSSFQVIIPQAMLTCVCHAWAEWITSWLWWLFLLHVSVVRGDTVYISWWVMFVWYMVTRCTSRDESRVSGAWWHGVHLLMSFLSSYTCFSGTWWQCHSCSLFPSPYSLSFDIPSTHYEDLSWKDLQSYCWYVFCLWKFCWCLSPVRLVLMLRLSLETQFTFCGFHSGKSFNSNAQPFPQCTPPQLDYDCAPCCTICLSLTLPLFLEETMNSYVLWATVESPGRLWMKLCVQWLVLRHAWALLMGLQCQPCSGAVWSSCGHWFFPLMRVAHTSGNLWITMFALKWTDRQDRQDSVGLMEGGKALCCHWVLDTENAI